MNEIVHNITEVVYKERGKSFHWIAFQSELKILAITATAIDIFRKLRPSYKQTPQNILFYSCLILSARQHGWDAIRGKGFRIAGQEQYKEFSNLREARICNLARDRSSPKKKLLLAHWGEVVELRRGTIGFRRIAKYLRKYKKINVSPSYIHKLWHEMQRGGNNAGVQ